MDIDQDFGSEYGDDATPDYDVWETEQVFQDTCAERDDYVFADDPDTFEPKDGEWTCESCGSVNSDEDAGCQWCDADEEPDEDLAEQDSEAGYGYHVTHWINNY